MVQDSWPALFTTLTDNLELFITEVTKKKSSQIATDKWTVKDELRHLVFWHENYAANYHALANNTNPPLLDIRGSSLNAYGVATLGKVSTQKLISRLRKAQASLRISILEKHVPKMTYKKGSRDYTTEEFLDMIAHHVATHTRQVRRAKKISSTQSN